MGVVARLDSERKLRLPEEWSEQFPPDQEVEMELCDDGVLVKPVRETPLQRALRRKFKINRPSHLDLSDLNMDTWDHESEDAGKT